MKRTTIYLDPELEVLLKLAARRQNLPMAEVIRMALRKQLGQEGGALPPGVGGYESGREDVAERAEQILGESEFGKD